MVTFRIRTHGADAIIARLDRLTPELRAALRVTIERITRRLQSHVLEQKLSGRPLSATRGPLHEAIARDVEETARGVRGWVGIRAGSKVARWAPVHEYGGPVRVPGHYRRGHYVHAHAYQARRRSFLRSTLRELRPEIEGELRLAVHAVVARAARA